MKLLASEHFRKKLEKWKIIRTVLFFEKIRNPVKYEMMKNEKQFFENSNWNITKNAIKKHKTATQKKSKKSISLSVIWIP